jgi:hypothetical protein
MGFLDQPLRQVSRDVIGLFTTAKARLTRVTKTYNSTTDTTSEVQESVDVKVSPPLPVTRDHLRGDPNLVATDTVVYVSALDLEEATPAISLLPGSDVTLFANVAGRDHAILRVAEYYSGDQAAILELFLRS